MMPKKRASEFLGAESAHTIKKKGSKDESTCVSLHNHTKTYTNLRCSGKQDLAWMHIDYAKNHTRVCTSHSGIICSWIAASQSICKPLSDHPPIVGLAGHVQLTLFFSPPQLQRPEQTARYDLLSDFYIARTCVVTCNTKPKIRGHGSAKRQVLVWRGAGYIVFSSSCRTLESHHMPGPVSWPDCHRRKSHHHTSWSCRSANMHIRTVLYVFWSKSTQCGPIYLDTQIM